MIICHKKIRIFFGNKENAIHATQQSFLDQLSWDCVTNFLQAEKLFGVQQLHGINGIQITKESDQHQSILTGADFLITHQIRYGLAIKTADCIPIIVYDSLSQAVALIHAGWKGIATGVVPTALIRMKKLYKTDMSTVEIFIGPSAQKCCYEIQADVYDIFKKMFPLCDDIFNYRDDKIFLDLTKIIRYQLIQNDILLQNIYQQFAHCTMCNISYCSYRREKNQLRNINAVALFL